MMKITILAVGKIKESFYAEAVSEYSKRLGRYCTLQITEVADEKTPEEAGKELVKQIKDREGERILKSLNPDSYVIALAVKGRSFTSEELAAKIDGLGLNGHSSVTFIIGGSLGLSDEVLKRADEQISFSAMTFPHQLMRVILLEQIYRSFKIIRHEPYHK